jgi:hypothetical protein
MKAYVMEYDMFSRTGGSKYQLSTQQPTLVGEAEYRTI